MQSSSSRPWQCRMGTAWLWNEVGSGGGNLSLESGLHSNAFDFMNHSRGSVQVIEMVTFLRNVSKKHKKQVENALKPVLQEGTKKANNYHVAGAV